MGGPKYDITLKPFLDHEIGPARQAMWALAAAIGVLLLIACANVSGLMLTRVSLRNHDDAIRLAIGGSRLAIARVWAAETVWLTALGGVLGLLTCPGADQGDRRTRARGHSAARRGDDRSAGRGVQHRGHGAGDAAVRRDADSSRQRGQPGGDVERRQPQHRRRPFVSHAIVAARAADRSRRRPAGRGRTGGAQLHGAAESRSRLHPRGGAAHEGRAAKRRPGSERVDRRVARGRALDERGRHPRAPST